MEPDIHPLGVHDVDLADWRWLLGALRADFAAPSLATAGALVAAVTTEVDEQLTSAEISVAGGRVLVTLRHGDPPVVTHAEVRLAQRISALAAEHGLTPEPGHIQALELGLDTPLDAGVRAGGTVVDRGEEPAFTVLADADGNKVCVCTALGRD
ncbi:hypothetical protein [Micropruina sonneratiae]|uniref:hypothetical protein n=1 Tax=Micropruina sonneratiae TaxID=2986940 RepID=UPI0022266178|nr:hypothetical protein [Micropruina sp. KQZ13P-5]MCW3159527.1 hypothetical protein [Micropruina sp. KQZ13P-5]